ncbi:hypothetical protein [Pleomorphomonas sp. PLEO]|uniref:hypothetical protein n=1 Tax=Pleomorphomonas sp. PLEO TaxID=3239306 RepID=UPI00351E3FF8
MASGLTGDKDLRAALRRMADEMASKGLDAAMVASLEPMKEATVANATRLRVPGPTPRGGHLDQGVAVVPKSRSRAKRIYWLTFAKRARKIAHLVEYGTAPHWQPNYRGGWMHPGARPKPFARPAFEQNKEETLSRLGRFAWQILRLSMVGGARTRR